MSERRGVYLSDRESAALLQLADEHNLTPSSVLRLGLRVLAGLPVSKEGRALLERVHGAPGMAVHPIQ